MNSGVSQLQDLLGIKLEDAWVQRSVHGNVDRDTLLKAFLLSDMAESSAGCLPVDWQVRDVWSGNGLNAALSRSVLQLILASSDAETTAAARHICSTTQ